MNKILFALALIVVVSCSDRKDEEKYVARVNDSYLTESELKFFAENYPLKGFTREEIIDHWVKEEILYQEAMKQGIVESDEYRRVIGKSEKELAGVMLLSRSEKDFKPKISKQQLDNYYNSKKEEFRLNSDSYILNHLRTDDNNFAVEFRSRAIEKGWEAAVEEMKNDSVMFEVNEKILVKKEDLSPQKFSRIVQGLYPLEISIVISDESEYHSVVQVVAIFTRDNIVPFEFVRNDIENRLAAESNKKNIENYIKSLYKQYSIELNN
ncbi:MAG TPA: peptidylprolyl isomerase [Ignavibacteriaceae bacterium]